MPLSETDRQNLAKLKEIFDKGGAKAVFQAIIPQLDRAYDRAVFYTRLGEIDRALSELEKAYADHDGSDLTQVKSDIRLTALHNEPRYKQLIQNMGLMQ
jgi:hypothetical protein